MQIAMVATDLSKWISFGQCRVRSLTGYNPQATDVYLQLHEVSKASAGTIISNGAVPTFKSLLCQAQNGFKWEFQDGLDFGELVMALSTTEANLTLPGAGLGMDFTLVVDGPYLVANFPTLTVVGDLTTGIATQQVWAEAAGPKTLMRIDAANLTGGAVRNILGFAVDAPLSTSLVQFRLPLPAGTTVTKWSNGAGDFLVMEKTPSDQALHQGLTLKNNAYNGAATELGIRSMYI